jgi:hypothetical protein
MRHIERKVFLELNGCVFRTSNRWYCAWYFPSDCTKLEFWDSNFPIEMKEGGSTVVFWQSSYNKYALTKQAYRKFLELTGARNEKSGA